jgi:hypothetical protein
MSHLEPITVSVIEYRLILAFVILLPAILGAAAIEVTLILAHAFARVQRHRRGHTNGA